MKDDNNSAKRSSRWVTIARAWLDPQEEVRLDIRRVSCCTNEARLQIRPAWGGRTLSEEAEGAEEAEGEEAVQVRPEDG